MGSRRLHVGAVSALLAVLSGCSAILPLGDEYTFDGGGDDGGTCEVPTQEEACAGLCGEVTVCDTGFTCSTCAGELACGQTNVCACESSPCAIGSLTVGDASEQVVVDMAVDGSGNVFLAGTFRGTVTFGADTYTNAGAVRSDIFLVKMSPAGEVLWSRAYWGTAAEPDIDQHLGGIAVDATGNVVLVGDVYGVTNLGNADLGTAGQSSMFIVKLEPDGDHVFSAAYGSASSSVDPYAVAINPGSQDIVVTGKLYGAVQFGSLSSISSAEPGGYYDIFLVRFAPNGTPAYAKRFGDTSEQIPDALVASGDYVFLSATFNGSFDFGLPNPTTVTTSDFYSLVLTKVGSTSIFAHEWTHQYGTDVARTHLAAGSTGNVFISGSFYGDLDIATPSLSDTLGHAFLANVDADGGTVWAKQFANLEINDISAGPDGSLYVVGVTEGDVDLGNGVVTSSGTNDPFIAHYAAANGAHLWSRVFGAAVGDQEATAIAVGAGNAIWMGAIYQGQIDLGDGVATTQGLNDVAVVRYVP